MTEIKIKGCFESWDSLLSHPLAPADERDCRFEDQLLSEVFRVAQNCNQKTNPFKGWDQFMDPLTIREFQAKEGTKGSGKLRLNLFPNTCFEILVLVTFEVDQNENRWEQREAQESAQRQLLMCLWAFDERVFSPSQCKVLAKKFAKKGEEGWEGLKILTQQVKDLLRGV